MAYERDNIQRLHAYVPGEQPGYADTARPGGVIKLNTNENPYPPSPKVMQAIHTLDPEALRLYPPAEAMGFRRAAAEVHGVQPEQVLATNGGDELLRMLLTVFCEPKQGGIGLTNPSYSLYPVLAAIQDTPVTVVDRIGADYALPTDLAAKWNQAGCALSFIVNPHAPTGRVEPIETLRALAEAYDGVLIVDEAYVDFTPNDALPLVEDGLENVILLRSLSKGYGLAGLRFGYALGPAALIASLDKARDSYNTDIVSQLAATAAIRDQDYAQSTWTKVIAERERLTTALEQRGFCVWSSQTNFLLCVPPESAPNAEAIYRALKQKNILIRYFSTPGLADKLRISLGTPAQNDALLAAIDQAMS